MPFEVSGKRTHAAIAGSEPALIEGGPYAVNATRPQQHNAARLDLLNG